MRNIGARRKITRLEVDALIMWLLARRLERDRFVWPSSVGREDADRTVTTTPAQLAYLP
jgi:IS66 Orf2 like protein